MQLKCRLRIIDPQVQQIILSSNLDFPTGNIQTREQKMLIRLAGKYKMLTNYET
jgi:multidrug efflux pump subunit AcrB